MSAPEMSLHSVIFETLESIIDPCSIASGAPAGLVSMGLVGDITIKDNQDGAQVTVTLFVTEPGCMMSTIFQITAQQKIGALEGVKSVEVSIDHGHVWHPEQMTADYRKRLREYRACQAAHMRTLNDDKTHQGRST